nr:MAG TPA: hypothetical protein [Caudoviricetes sp.]
MRLISLLGNINQINQSNSITGRVTAAKHHL